MAFVRNPVVYVPDLTNGRPIVDGKVYLLTAGTVPPTQDSAINPATLLTVTYVNEAGNTVEQPQPLYTSKGGCLYGSFPEEARQYMIAPQEYVFAAYDKNGRLQYSAETFADDYVESAVLGASGSTVLVGGVEAGEIANKSELIQLPAGSNNTAFGEGALIVTSGAAPVGSDNVAVGNGALQNNTEGYRSVAVGYQAAFLNQGTLVYGNSLTAVGYRALYNNEEGKDNTALGYLSQFFTKGGSGNSSVGYRALYSVTGTTVGAPTWASVDGSFNTSMGYESMLSTTLGNSNSAYGWRTMFNTTTGNRNTAVGQEALRANTTGSNNVAIGYQAAQSSTTAADNTAVGYTALRDNTAAANSAFGRDALLLNTIGAGNTAVGYQALDANTTANFSTAVGRGALTASNGNNNTAIGYNAAAALTTAINCTALGVDALSGNTVFSNCTGVGRAALVTNNNQVQLGDSSTTTYAFGAVQDRSDARDKIDVRALTDAHIAFFMEVEWRQYRLDYRDSYFEITESGEVIEHEKDGSKAGVRYHIGAIAQQVEAAMLKHGVDFAGLQHHAYSGGKDVYTIGYQEFIGIQGEIIQRQQKRLDSIEQRLSAAGL